MSEDFEKKKQNGFLGFFLGIIAKKILFTWKVFWDSIYLNLLQLLRELKAFERRQNDDRSSPEERGSYYEGEFQDK